MTSRQYTGYCLAVCLLVTVVKLWLGTHVLSTALFDDDHEYLNRSIYVLQGNLELTDYPFTRHPYGPLYPLVVSPWTLFADPATRLTVVFAINALLSAVAVFFGSLIVFRLTSIPSLLAPLCLAAYGPLFQFSFYAMSENLIFPLIAIVGWLAVDFDQTCKSALKLMLLVLLVLLLPLVRVPGLAVVPALLLLLCLNRRQLSQQSFLAFAAGLGILLPAVSYYGFYHLTLNSGREAEYLTHLRQVVSSTDHLLFPLKLTVSQMGYLFLSTGYWVLPVFVVRALQIRASSRNPQRQRWVNYLTYAGVSGAGFVFFTLVHLAQKLGFENPDFFYGRYNDPAGLLLLIGGLAGVLTLEPPNRVQGFLLRVVSPLAAAMLLVKIGGGPYSPINQSGLAIYALGAPVARDIVLTVVIGTLLNQLADKKRWYALAALAFFLAFSLLTNRNGMEYTIQRAGRGAHSLEAAEWISRNLPVDARIGYDVRILRKEAPGGVKMMANVYRAMMFRTHPRQTILAHPGWNLKRGDYFYTTKNADEGLVTVWSNGDYKLRRVSED